MARILVIVVAQAFLARSALAAVQVYLGYLPAETSGVVTTMLSEHPDQKLLVVDNYASPNNIFGYSYWVKPEVKSSNDPVINEDADVDLDKDPLPADKDGGLLGWLFGSKPAKPAVPPKPAAPLPQDAQAKSVLDLIEKNSQSGFASYKVAEFPVKGMDPKSGAKDLIVVVRPPVNGRDAVGLNKFLNAVLPSLAQLPQAKNGGIRLSSFGTAGGIDPSLGPNDVTPVKSSLFVGAVSKPATSDSLFSQPYEATIRFTELGSGKPATVLYSAEFPSKAEAEAAAQKAFAAWVDPPPLPTKESECQDFLESTGGLDPVWFQAVANHELLTAIRSGHDTSLTVSFFAGPDLKTEAQKMGLTNVNMEDYHLIQFLNSDKGSAYRSSAIDRVVADPSLLPPEASASIRDWYANATYSRSKYVDAILWGLQGARLNHVPESAKWDVFSKFPAKQSEKWVSKLQFKDGNAPLDPFYYNIAENFLDAANSKELGLSAFAEAYHDKLSATARNQLNKLVSARSGELQALAENMSAKTGDPAPREVVEQFVDKTSALSISKEPLRSELAALQDPKAPPAGDVRFPLLARDQSPENMNIWVSPNGNTLMGFAPPASGTRPDVSDAISTGDDDINRALYKLSLVGLTQTATAPHTRQEFQRMRQESESEAP